MRIATGSRMRAPSFMNIRFNFALARDGMRDGIAHICAYARKALEDTLSSSTTVLST